MVACAWLRFAAKSGSAADRPTSGQSRLKWLDKFAIGKPFQVRIDDRLPRSDSFNDFDMGPGVDSRRHLGDADPIVITNQINKGLARFVEANRPRRQHPRGELRFHFNRGLAEHSWQQPAVGIFEHPFDRHHSRAWIEGTSDPRDLHFDGRLGPKRGKGQGERITGLNEWSIDFG